MNTNKSQKDLFSMTIIKKDMSSAAAVISSALRFIYKQTTFRNIFLIYCRK